MKVTSQMRSDSAVLIRARTADSPNSLCGIEGRAWLERELPGLGDEVFAEAVVWLLNDACEAGGRVEVTRGEQVRRRPQRDLLIASGPREPDALVD